MPSIRARRSPTCSRCGSGSAAWPGCASRMSATGTTSRTRCCSAGALAGLDVRVATPPGYAPDPDVVARARALGRATSGRISVGTDPAEAVAGADAVYTDVWTSMGREAEADERRSALRRLPGDRVAPRPCGAARRRDALHAGASRARRSARPCSTVPARWPSSRPRTGATSRRPCSSSCSAPVRRRTRSDARRAATQQLGADEHEHRQHQRRPVTPRRSPIQLERAGEPLADADQRRACIVELGAALTALPAQAAFTGRGRPVISVHGRRQIRVALAVLELGLELLDLATDPVEPRWTVSTSSIAPRARAASGRGLRRLQV